MAIGVDVDQYNTYPEVKDALVTSAAKNVDVAVYKYLKAVNGRHGQGRRPDRQPQERRRGPGPLSRLGQQDPADREGQGEGSRRRPEERQAPDRLQAVDVSCVKGADAERSTRDSEGCWCDVANCAAPFVVLASAGLERAMTLALQATGITKRFPGVLANDHVRLRPGEGRDSCLAGRKRRGQVHADEHPLRALPARRRRDSRRRTAGAASSAPHDAIAQGIGMVHQHFMLVPPLTVTENIMLGQESLVAATQGAGRAGGARPAQRRPRASAS